MWFKSKNLFDEPLAHKKEETSKLKEARELLASLESALEKAPKALASLDKTIVESKDERGKLETTIAQARRRGQGRW